jgi:hypothetical protein
MVFPTHDPPINSAAAVTKDVVVVDLCSDSDDEKPKAKDSSSTIGIDVTVDTYTGTSSSASLLGKKRARPLQTESCISMGMATTSSAAAKVSKTEDCVVVTEEELSNNSNIVPTMTPPTPPLIFIDGDDNINVTEGIPELLSTRFPKTKTPGSDMVTCVGQTPHAATTNSDMGHASSMTTTTTTTTTLRHIQQKDKWSCGFRNVQMMMTALVPILPPDHPYFQDVNGGRGDGRRDQAGSFAIYSLRQIQQLLEELWKAGWDITGAQHFQYRIVGKQSRIGAVEVSSALSYRGVDNVVVQFIKCAESRRQLGPFCWAYFKRQSGCSTCRSGGGAAAAGTHSSNNNNMSSQAIAERLLASNTNAAGAPAGGGTCSCSILPLYLQWEGHSVTIVGVERQMNGGSTSSGLEVDKMNLLVLDPVQDGTKLEQALSRGNLAPARLTCKRLQAKDCQIVLCTSRPLSMYEMQQRQQQVCAVTAAQDAVMKIAQRGM